jgi:hypothetical protein
MSRRSITARAWAERSYAVRVHIRTPESGFQAQNQLEALLRERLGKSFHLGSERGFGSGTASVVVYANDLAAVTDIVDRLGCEINLVRNCFRPEPLNE